MTELLWVVLGIVVGGGLVAGRRWSSLDAARFEADVNWNRYVESERQHNNMRHDLEAARIRINTLEGERDLAAYQLTQHAADVRRVHARTPGADRDAGGERGCCEVGNNCAATHDIALDNERTRNT